MDYNIQTKKYEGPMDLLLDLINRKKINISDISILEITEQYVNYVDNMEVMDMELASDFISMASKLLEIKSRYILYIKKNNLEEEDPREELIRQIEEYQKYKQISDSLFRNIDEYDKRYYRTNVDTIIEDELTHVDLSNISIEEIKKILPTLFGNIKTQNIKDVVANEKLDAIVKKPLVHVESKIEKIRSLLENGKDIFFEEIIEYNDKNEVIANFLAILELIKLKEIVIYQERFCDDIVIKKMNSNL